MNILQVCSAHEIGGGERHVVGLANSLAERGHAVYAALIPDSPLISELSFLPKHHILKVRMRNSLDLSSAIKLARFAQEQAAEIIHAHVARDYPLAAFASWRAGDIPYVLTRHVLFPLKSVHRLTLRRVSRVIAVSQAVTAALQQQGIFDPSTIVTIPNGIDTRRFAKKPADKPRHSFLDKSGAQFLVGMAGHLAPIKGQEEFIRAAAIIASQRTDINFVIVGEDKSHTGENRRATTRLIAQLGLTKRIHLMGWLPDVRDLLGALDLFVSPSRSEPFGLVIVEAMASGLPVVATMSEGAREIIEDGVTGRLVPIGDTESLARAIIDLLTDKSEHQRFSVNALDVVRQHFSLERMVDVTEQLYLNVLTGRSEDSDKGRAFNT
jgi:glycosyltransferase involved in cell wall biosynthesis